MSAFAFARRLRKIPVEQRFPDFCPDLARAGVEPIGLHHSRGASQCNPQVRRVENTTTHLVGRYENRQAETARLLELPGLPAAGIPHLNATRHRDCRSYYCKESRRIAEAFYAEDFAYFGYPTALRPDNAPAPVAETGSETRCSSRFGRYNRDA